MLDGDPAPPLQKGTEPQPILGARLLSPNGRMDQCETWHVDRLGPGHSTPKKGHSPPQFWAHVRCGPTSGWTKMPRGMEVCLGPGYFVLDGDPAPPEG